MNRKVIALAAIWCAAVCCACADEGMWPLSEIKGLDLAGKGLKVEASEIYAPGQVGLIDAIVHVGRCTGSFVSPRGLVFTNHHCAVRAAQSASTQDNDYLEQGFAARSLEEELPAPGYSVRITESYRDVSAEVLAEARPGMDYEARTKAIERKMREIKESVEQNQPGKRAEVAEMFSGKVYTLFVYAYLPDVRLVFLLPEAIGEFGGETDNWMWPRHTGDFAFMRAYTAPDGSAAEYAPENVPYQPRKILRIEPAGVDEGDFIFLLGYPGTTYRHRTSHFLSHERRVRLPYVADLYEWQISVMQRMSAKSREIAIRHFSRIDGLSNTMKNYRGKIAGIDRLDLIERKKAEERSLSAFLAADEERQTKYGAILGKIEAVYREIDASAEQHLLLSQMTSASTLLGFGKTLCENARERQKQDMERSLPYKDRNYQATRDRLMQNLKDYYEPTDRTLISEMLRQASRLPQGSKIEALEKIACAEGGVEGFVERAYSESKLSDPEFLLRALSLSPSDLEALSDPFVRLAGQLEPAFQKRDKEQDRQRGILDSLYGRLLEAQREFAGANFIPDANGTLRLTTGRIRGYSPTDAVHCRPISSLAGVMEKDTGASPFRVPKKLRDLYEAKDFGRFAHAGLGSVPVCLLYDADTTGGNSGSPILNACGRVVGINFDRAWEATVNDYRWSADYSRSIGVDIRYVLWTLEKFAGADHLLAEMGAGAE